MIGWAGTTFWLSGFRPPGRLGRLQSTWNNSGMVCHHSPSARELREHIRPHMGMEMFVLLDLIRIQPDDLRDAHHPATGRTRTCVAPPSTSSADPVVDPESGLAR